MGNRHVFRCSVNNQFLNNNHNGQCFTNASACMTNDTLKHVFMYPLSWWWRHQMETFSALLAICAGNSPVSGDFPAQRPVTKRFDIFLDLRLHKRLSKQSRGWWFETLSCPLWRQCNDTSGGALQTRSISWLPMRLLIVSLYEQAPTGF